MNIDSIEIGNDVPHEVNAIIEIPSMGAAVKYELDKESGALIVDRFLGTAMYYPCNYGFIPHTLSEDGDPLDILVITRVPLLPSSVITCRPIGVLKMVDESGIDMKIIAVPTTKLARFYDHVKEPEDLPEGRLSELSHFFEQYKALEDGKWAKIDGWDGSEAAKKEITACVKRFDEYMESKNNQS